MHRAESDPTAVNDPVTSHGSSTNLMNGAKPATLSNGGIRRTASFSDYHNTTISSSSGASTEGWLELFLTPTQKRTFSHWRETINDKSLTHRATKGLFDNIAEWIPDNVAPNVVTAGGLLCLGQAWYVANLYGKC